MQSEKELELCKRRFLDLANVAYYREYAVFSDFLSLNEQSIFYEIQQQCPAAFCKMWGGNEMAERKMLCFSGQEVGVEEFPIRVLQIRPSNLKFSGNLTHRDYLGAILGLGIERSKIGDLVVNDQGAYVYVEDGMFEYLCSSLEQVKHTKVSCVELKESFEWEQKYKEITGTVSSVRLDSVIALAFHTSRSSLLEMVSSGKVFVNGRLVTTNGYRLKEKDIISVRGKGKFRLNEIGEVTKKGKIRITVEQYV